MANKMLPAPVKSSKRLDTLTKDRQPEGPQETEGSRMTHLHPAESGI